MDDGKKILYPLRRNHDHAGKRPHMRYYRIKILDKNYFYIIYELLTMNYPHIFY